MRNSVTGFGSGRVRRSGRFERQRASALWVLLGTLPFSVACPADPVTVGVGETCDAEEHWCGADALCIRHTDTDRCHATCNTDTDCEGAGLCNPASVGGHVCDAAALPRRQSVSTLQAQPLLPGKPGEPCNFSAAQECASGATCLANPGPTRRCHALCDRDADCGGAAGKCTTFSDASVRLSACQFPVPPAETGSAIETPAAATLGAPRKAGEACNLTGGRPCVDGVICNTNDQLCYALCETDADCEGADTCEAYPSLSGNAPISVCVSDTPPPGMQPMRGEGTPVAPGMSPLQSPGGASAATASYAGKGECDALRARYAARYPDESTCPEMLTSMRGTYRELEPVPNANCMRDIYVNVALQYCWAANCYAILRVTQADVDAMRAGFTPATAAAAAIDQLGNADALCSTAPVLTTPQECPTREIYACECERGVCP